MKAYERLLRYAQFDTASHEGMGCCPSTEGQLVLGRALVTEMHAMGIANAEIDEHGYVYASIPATAEGYPAIGLIAHMDTVDCVPVLPMNARIVENYDGGDVQLAGGDTLSPRDYPELVERRGKNLIVTDGKTLLGADDKAGIAEILTACERILSEKQPHGKICISFTPDEEVGGGPTHFDVPGFGADFADTVDGGEVGSYNYENFNACAAKVAVRGVSIHPGSAKHKMKNAARIAMQFASLLPAGEVPELTEGYEGFSHLTNMSGDCENAVLHYIIRDHDREKFEQKKQRFERVAAFLNAEYGEGTVTLSLRDTYYNMKEVILPDQKRVLDLAVNAMKGMGIAPAAEAIRGGTDGCRLSFMGLPCPNLCAGGYNCHGRYEYISVQSLKTCAEILIRIAKDAAK